MKNHLEILKSHEVLTETSCVAWGIEYILKVNGKFSPHINLQENPSSINGFESKTLNFLSGYGIPTKSGSLKLDDFHRLAIVNGMKGKPIIFTFPVSIGIKHDPIELGEFSQFHVAMAIYGDGDIHYISKNTGNPNLITIPIFEMKSFVENKLERQFHVDYLLQA